MRQPRVALESESAQAAERVLHSTQFEYPAAATLTRTEVCACIEDTGVIPVLDKASEEDALFVAEALTEAGIPILKISMNAPNAIELISLLVKHVPTTIVGAGSVRNAVIARKCADAGAKFLTTDGLIPGVIEFAVKEGLATVAGALTLTEVLASWDAGSDFVKVVPCYAVGGPRYIGTLKAAIPQARLVASGGVNQLTALNYIAAGAAALGVGQELIPTEAILQRQARRIQELARRFLTAVDNGRA
jgi:2-dehydro-3-deoxyphosphogluconate aldolase / (4S)-4-hydroxy-2-oxoglutarate aldolase